jgi:hypothetical protein
MDEFRRIIGREVSLDQFHLTLRRAAAQVAGISSYGACLITCSDERQGQIRASFERDVATSLIADVTNARDRVFSVSNLCGRLEPGAFALVDDHFTRLAARGPKLLIIEIAAHVGRLRREDGFRYGQVERFGRLSPCCGALTSLLNPTGVMATVRHPWFEQLNAFFGPVRLAALRGMQGPTQLLAAAIVHAALQGESALAEVLHASFTVPTDVLLIAGVAINQQWADGFLPVAWHHLRSRDGATRILSGFSLRTTPEALTIDISGARALVDGGEAMENMPQVRRSTAAATAASAAAAAGAAAMASEPGMAAAVPAALATLEQLGPEQRALLDARLAAVREQIASVRNDPAAWRSYARPVLRGLFRGLCVAQPELGLAALLYEGGGELFATHKLKQLALHGPASADGRRVLHEIEAELQQLNHEDAQQLLEALLKQERQRQVS